MATNTIEGSTGIDILIGTNADDRINARAGNDVAFALNGEDTFFGGGGDGRANLWNQSPHGTLPRRCRSRTGVNVARRGSGTRRLALS
jgi:Ca2+-binding RTX toxin-like protein